MEEKREYLEYFEGAFDSTVADKMKIENWPYVAYSKTDGVIFTVVPEPIPDNEIWYTSSYDSPVNPFSTNVFGANIVSNTYENGKGIIKFDNSVTSIGYRAFYYGSSLTSITLPNSVTSIESYAFQYCSSLTSVTIPESVTYIGINAFAGTDIYNDAENWVQIETWAKGVLYVDNCLIKATSNISGAYEIKVNTRLIANNAFYDCSKLTSVVIPDGVTSIGQLAFYNCTSLKSITIPNSVTSIGDQIFWYCSKLTSVVIPDGVTSIGGRTFSGCSSLTSVVIGKGVTNIADNAFSGCSSLNSITFKGTIEEWNAIEKGVSWDGKTWNNDVPATYVQCTDGQVAL